MLTSFVEIVFRKGAEFGGGREEVGGYQIQGSWGAVARGDGVVRGFRGTHTHTAQPSTSVTW